MHGMQDIMREVVVEDERKYKICNYINVMRSISWDDIRRKCLAGIGEVKCVGIPVELDESVLYDVVLSVMARGILRVLGVDEGVLYNVDINRDGNILLVYGVGYYYWVEAEPDPDVCERIVFHRFIVA